MFALKINKTVYSISPSAYKRLLCTRSSVEFEAKDNFTPEQHSKILQALNDSPPDILSRYRISNARIKSISEWKLRKGPFRTLEDVLEVDGFGESSLEDICKRIVNNNLSKPKTAARQHKYFKNLLIPEMDSRLCTTLRRAVAIHVDPTGIGWVTLSKDTNELSEWAYKDLTSFPTKMSPSDTFDLALEIRQMTPVGDIYVFESQSNMNHQNNQNKVTTHAHQVELMAMLLALLNTSVKHNQTFNDTQNREAKLENRVFYVKNKVPARLFNILIGFEKVSAIPKIMSLLKGEAAVLDSVPCTPVLVDKALRDYFSSQSGSNKELLAQVLMLGISFMDLCVRKNKESIDALLQKSQKGKDEVRSSFIKPDAGLS